jgi:hypothetical protein
MSGLNSDELSEKPAFLGILFRLRTNCENKIF